mmetsp:Transcript_43040/g.89610  ORF Transcript_43040/g.89610 Transcript_43040/m.89610 type:complete len:88 (-) Transcript_43040:214-477(-)
MASGPWSVCYLPRGQHIGASNHKRQKDPWKEGRDPKKDGFNHPSILPIYMPSKNRFAPKDPLPSYEVQTTLWVALFNFIYLSIHEMN